MIVDLSRQECSGRDVGTYYSPRQITVMPASLIGGLLWGISPYLPFYVAFAVGILGAALFAVYSHTPSPPHSHTLSAPASLAWVMTTSA